MRNFIWYAYRIGNTNCQLAVKWIPNIDQIRMVNSGTEACMSAVRLARVYWKRKIIKFAGCYHGHSDAFLIQAGCAVTFEPPTVLGYSRYCQRHPLAKYNNLESVAIHFEQHPEQIAAIIIEPVAGNMGCIPPKSSLLGLRKLCDEHNALLIFDEVMTGFRLAKGGAQECLKIKADICTYGKVLGGGLPVGALCKKRNNEAFGS